MGTMKIPAIQKQEPLQAEAGVSKLFKVELAHIPRAVLLKEPAHFWDEIFITNEAYMLGEITHPRVRRKLAYDAVAHRLFLEYVEAETLGELVRSGVTVQDPRRTHSILQAVAETVADMHAGVLCVRPVVHNDLKSMNVLVPKDSPQEALLIDFSHSYFRHHLPPFLTDKRDDRMGTAKYMAPEKWEKDFTHGSKGDVFAFGVLAYYAHTGKHPFDGSVAEIERQIREVTPPSPLELGSNVFRNLVATIMSCLEKKPDRRPGMEAVAKSYADSVSLFR
jgi:serine/threonine-protein kinase